MIICNIILTSLLIFLVLSLFLVLRSFYNIKKAFDEVLINIMKNHESFIIIQKNILKEFKNKFDDISKIEKDINTIRTNLKNLLEDFRSKIKLLTDKIEK